MLLQLALVGQQAIEGPIEPVVVHQRRRQREQVLERGPPIPVLGDVQLARGLAETGQHEHLRHRGPWHRLARLGQQPVQHLIEPQRTLERPAEPDVAEGAAALEPNPLEANWNGLVGVARLEEVRLLALTGDGPGQRLGPRPALGVKFAEVRDCLLDNLAPHAD